MGDAPSSKLWSYAFVVTISAIIVAMGTKELERRFARRGGDADIKQIVRELKADPTELRASFAKRERKVEEGAPAEEVSQEDRQELKKIIEKIAP